VQRVGGRIELVLHRLPHRSKQRRLLNELPDTRTHGIETVLLAALEIEEDRLAIQLAEHDVFSHAYASVE